ncbi:hypothetical protein P5673_018713, partial [Acropora cervicornis]
MHLSYIRLLLLALVFRTWINDEILTAKRLRRKAERRWRASRSTTDLLPFRLCRNRVSFPLNKARCAYYTNFVSKIVSTRGNFSLNVLELIKSSTKTTCSLDPIPTKLFTECLDVLLTPITKLINLSLELGCFPLLWKRALVKPLLKKDGLDPIFKNFRPVSNLAYASKLVETV